MFTAIVHLCASALYGYHRDELYLIACGKRLSAGSIDHPPITPLLTRLVSEFFGDGPAAHRVLPALAGGLVVWLTGATAGRLKGGVAAQLLAGGSAAIAPFFIYAAGVNGTNALEPLFWIAASYVVLSLVGDASEPGRSRAVASVSFRDRARPRWVLFGAVVGLGALNKYTMLWYGLALAAGLLASSARARFREPGPWLALLTAAAIVMPYAAWTWFHRLPTLEFLRERFEYARRETSLASLLVEQIKLLGPLSFLVAMVGLISSLRRRAPPERRVLGVAFSVVLLVVLAVRGKAYYVAPAYLPLLALGAVECGTLLASTRARIRAALGPLWIAAGLIALLGTLPVLPEGLRLRLRLHRINRELAQFADWKGLVMQIGRSYSPFAARHPGILTDSYGTAAAIELLGSDVQLPHPLSGSNSYYFWNRDSPEPEELLSIGYSPEVLRQAFGRVETVGLLQMPSGLDNHFDFPRLIYHCYDKRKTLRDIWPQLRRFE